MKHFTTKGNEFNRRMLLKSLAGVAVLSGCGEPSPEFSVQVQDRTLREVVANRWGEFGMLIGATLNSDALGTPASSILGNEFNYCTQGQDFRQQIIHPEPGVWNWSQADPWFDFAPANSLKMRIHGPIGPQCSNWVKNDNRTPAELEQNLREFMEALCVKIEKFAPDHVVMMDVVNEVVAGPDWNDGRVGVQLWECPWYHIGLDTGGVPSYIRIAFEIANEFAPNVKLIFNNYQFPGGPGWTLVNQAIAHLKDSGLRVDGIGWQAHVDTGYERHEGNLDDFNTLISSTHNNGMGFHVTEFSSYVNLASNEGHDLKMDPTPEMFLLQAKTYRSVLKTLMDHRHNGEVSWNTWHVTDALGWHADWFPSMWDASYEKKPAYFAIHRILERY